MLRRYKLKLVTTSMECAHAIADVPRTPTEAINEADAMAAGPLQMEACRESEPVDQGGAALTVEVRGLYFQVSNVFGDRVCSSRVPFSLKVEAAA